MKNADVVCELDDARRDYKKERAGHLEARTLMFEMLDKIKALRSHIKNLEAGEPTESIQNVRKTFFKLNFLLNLKTIFAIDYEKYQRIRN